jgi:Uma2 family endonuclease
MVATRAQLPSKRRITADEFQQMARAGIFHEDDHIELLDGELYQMAAMNEPHVSCVVRLNYWFVPRLINRAIVLPQCAIRLSDFSEPEPDIVLARFREDFYVSALPRPEDILLIIEVADSSLRHDRTVKVPLYAAAGISETWIANVRSQRVTTYREPSAAGYQQVTHHTRRAVLSPQAFPDLQLRWEDIFGQA